MLEIFHLIGSFIDDCVGLLNGISFNMFGITISYFAIVFGFIALSMVISLFWKGGRG